LILEKKKTYISVLKNLLDGKHEEQSVQQAGQQPPNQQCQQQPSNGATHSHTESTYACCAPNTQPSAAEPVGSPAAATTTTSVQAWRIFKDSSNHFLAS
jgi:hypothetical protein